MSLLGLPPLRPHFDAAVRDVSARDPELRVQAAERLGDATPTETPRAVVALRAMLKDVHPRVRCAAAAACAHLGSTALDGDLAALVDDPDPTVREISVVSLSRIGGEIAVAAVREALSSEHPETRFQAVVSFVELCPDDVSPLAPLVRDEDPMVRANTATALSDSAALDADALLRQCLIDHNPQVRRRAAVALALRGDARGYDDVLASLDDAELVLDALNALGALADPRATEPIAHKAIGLFVPLVVKAAAGSTLLRLGDPRGVDLLRGVLRAWRSDGRSFAVELIGSFQFKALIPELVTLASRPRGTDRAALARALAAFGAPGEEVKNALEVLANGGGEAAEIAREALLATEKAR